MSDPLTLDDLTFEEPIDRQNEVAEGGTGLPDWFVEEPEQINIDPLVEQSQNPPEMRNKIKVSETLTGALGLPPEITYDNQKPTIKSFVGHMKEILNNEDVGFLRASGERMIQRWESGTHKDMWGWMKEFGQDVSQAWVNGKAIEDSAQVGYEMALKEFAGKDVTNLEMQYNTLQEARVDLTKVDWDDPATLVNMIKPRNMLLSAVEMTPMMLETLKDAVPGIILGAGLGAVAGGLAGNAPGVTLATPEELFTVPGGAIAGARIGSNVGSFEATARREMGLAYGELRQIKDGFGNKLDPKITFAFSSAIGLANGLLEVGQIRGVLKTIPGLNKFFKEAVSEASQQAIRRTSAQVLMHGAGEYAKYLGKETAQEMGQEFSLILFSEIAKAVNNKLKKSNLDHTTVGKALMQLTQVGLQSFGAFAVMGAPGSAIKTTADLQNMGKLRQAFNDAKKKMADEGMTMKPDKMAQNFIDQVYTEAQEQNVEFAEEATTIDDLEQEPTITAEEFVEQEKDYLDELHDSIRELEKEKEGYTKAFLKPGETDDYVVELDNMIREKEMEMDRYFESEVEAVGEKSYGEQEELVMRNVPDTREKLEFALQELYSNHTRGLSKAWYWAADRAAGPRAGRGMVSDKLAAKLLKEVHNNPRKYAEIFAVVSQDREAMEAIKYQYETDQSVEQDFQVAEGDYENLTQSRAKVDEMLARLDLAKEATNKAEKARILTGTETLADLQGAVYQTSKKSFSAGRQVGAEETKQHYRAKEFAQKQRKKLSDSVNKIKGVINRLGKRNLYPDLQEAFDEMVSGIDTKFRSKSDKEIITNMSTALNVLSEIEGEGYGIPPGMVDKIKLVDRRNLRDMTLDELDYLYQTLRHIEKVQGERNTLRRRGDRMKKERAIDIMVSNELRPEKEITSDLKSISTEKGLNLKGFLNSVAGLGQFAYSFIAEIVADRNSIFHDVFVRRLEQGTTKMLNVKHELQNIAVEEKMVRLGAERGKDDTPTWTNTTIKNIDKWKKEELPITVYIDGKKAEKTMPRISRISLYRLSLNEGTRRSIVEAGFGVQHNKSLEDRIITFGKDPIESSRNLDAFLSQMSEEEVNYAMTFDAVAERGYELSNEIHVRREGFDIPKEDHYFKTKAMPQAYNSTERAEMEKQQFSEHYQKVGLEKGSFIPRTDNPKPLVLEDFDKVTARYIRQVSAYVGLEEPVSDAAKILYDPRFKKEIRSRYSVEMWDYLENGLKDIAGVRNQYDLIETTMMALKNNVAVARLGLNPGVIVKQGFSYALYAPYVKPVYLARALAEYAVNAKKINEMNETYSARFYERKNTSGMRDVAEAIGTAPEERAITGQRKGLREIAMSPIKFVDVNVVSPGIWAAVMQTMESIKEGDVTTETLEALGMTLEELQELEPHKQLEKAYEFADYATNRSQPAFDVMHRSALSRHKNMAVRMMTMFSGFTSQAYNLGARSIADLARAMQSTDAAKKKAAIGKFAKAMAAILVAAPMGAAAVNSGLSSFYRWDEEEWWKQFLKDWPLQVAGYPLFGRDIAGNIVSMAKYGNAGSGGLGSPVSDVGGTMFDSVRYFWKGNLGKGFDKMAEFVTLVMGIPYSPMRSIYKGTRNRMRTVGPTQKAESTYRRTQ